MCHILIMGVMQHCHKSRKTYVDNIILRFWGNSICRTVITMNYYFVKRNGKFFNSKE